MVIISQVVHVLTTHDNAVSLQVTAEILPESQSFVIIDLLKHVFSMVKKSPLDAVSICVSIANTPTSSPSAPRRSKPLPEGSTVKVNFMLIGPQE